MPHSMKSRIYLFLLLPLVALSLVSCEEKAQSTPSLQASSYLLRTSAAGVLDTISANDTLHLGDTVLMGLAIYGNFNYLTGVRVEADTAKMQLGFRWNPADDKYLAQGSDPEHGVLLFVPEQINLCVTTLQYTPIKAGTHRVEIVVSSDAGANFSPRTFYFDALAVDTVPASSTNP